MTTLVNLLDDLRDRLDDPEDVAISEVRKVRWLNRGIAAIWPDIYVRVTVDKAITYEDGTYNYPLPEAFDGAMVYRVRAYVAGDTGQAFSVEDWECPRVPGQPVLEIGAAALGDGAVLVVDAVKPVAQLVADEDVFGGLPGTEELPVLYAMAIAAGRGLEGRLDYTHYSTRNGQNGVGTAEIEGAANYFMGLFRDLLDANSMAFPAVRG